MTHLKKNEVAQLERKLRDRQQSLLEDVRSELDERENQQLANVMGNHPGDSGDISLADALADLNILRVDRQIRELREIEASFTRISQGIVNDCVDCGRDIGLQRLLANPTATRCVTCQQKHEQLYATPGHPAL
jgi:DnaK suppressor protein